MKTTYIYRIISPIAAAFLRQSIYELHIFNKILFPSLLDIVNKAYHILSSSIGYINIGHTLVNAVLGFIIAAAIGIPIGLLLGASKKAYQSSEVMVHFFRSLPATAIFPVFLLFFGINDSSKVAISCFISLWIIILASSSGVIYSNPVRIKVLHMLGARGSSFYKQLFYNSLSHICVGLKTASAMTLIVVIVTEVFVGSSYGIGQQIYDAYIVYDCVSLFARVLITGVLGYGINVALSQFEKSIIHWRN